MPLRAGERGGRVADEEMPQSPGVGRAENRGKGTGHPRTPPRYLERIHVSGHSFADGAIFFQNPGGQRLEID